MLKKNSTDFWVSIDTTRMPGIVANAVDVSNNKRGDDGLYLTHRYDMRRMLRLYPVVMKLETLCISAAGLPRENWCGNWPRVFQNEATLIWTRDSRDAGFGPYRQVWIVQDDVEYTGNPASFLSSFAGYDLVSSRLFIEKNNKGRQIMLYDTSNIWYGDEGVRGYSLRLLDFLERESQEERGSWSEFAAPTVCCEIMPGCTWAQFDKASISPRFYWSQNTGRKRLSAGELKKLVDDGADHGRWRNAWVHKVFDSPSTSVEHNSFFFSRYLFLLVFMIAVFFGAFRRRWCCCFRRKEHF